MKQTFLGITVDMHGGRTARFMSPLHQIHDINQLYMAVHLNEFVLVISVDC